MKVLIVAVLLMIVLAAALWLYLALRYPEVQPGLRAAGWLISSVTRYDTEEGLRRFARMANAVMKLPVPRDRKLKIREVVIRGQDGNDLPLLIYGPAESGPAGPGLLWIHGGGYAIGTPRAEKGFLKNLVLETGTVVVAPDYRRSVAAPYPAAFHDCWDALLWMRQQTDQLGIRSDQLFVGGESAGGGLTAAVCMYARDSGEVQVAFQMPVYPMLNDRMDTASMIGNRGMLWDEGRNRAAWRVYLGELYGTQEVPVYASPARQTDFNGLPPAYTFVGTLDPFYDETLQYMQALQACGITAVYNVYEGAFHGFDVIPCRFSRQARARLLQAYQYAAAQYRVPQTGSPVIP